MVLGEGLVIMYHAGCKRNGGPLVHHLHTHQLKVENKQNGQHTDIHVCIYIYIIHTWSPPHQNLPLALIAGIVILSCCPSFLRYLYTATQVFTQPFK
jgi:hypothetical protein